ncbi:serglycin [Pteropus alecto]|uniref:Serglycin n=2 Tax=Pteropus TaxID=9401 RepID=A0A6P3QV83_PTEVA|nr:serglycin [Pteropus alecto]XP_011370453.1 serglycin [Pteropus vampyrus]ELK09583.1 Serglycin [Pteropus alecto]
MQVLLQCRRLVLALILILVLDSSVQGSPVRRARYQWVRCNPDSNSINCVDEKGPEFDLPPGESNRILSPRTDPFSMTIPQNLNDVFPLSEDYSGSGSGSDSGSGFSTETEQEYQPADKDDAFYYNFRPLPSDDQDLGRDGPEENFIM